ncbi:ATP phosphoribosyltransferase regulatory subunit [Thauera sp.]|jgi:ATP phosphoribosyltransferase regulatory subunit|uniref:ATP phosphoribosyltransferase regulatory subunit n=1 Tax=Thauera sp. TaxID=1905334 RepID=UPI002A36D075|nr:ATP phosphoribosyltransferase regulatory subunit [Thauera sp.]MDX9886102.1 ATP phosphoribosyltransferase regulatory subunit [Thauera sp.]
MRWVLPDHIQDALPSDAHQLEALRRRLLDAFRVRGYQLVMPPLLEYLDSLTTGAGRDLALRTFTLVDQLSGRTMGVRADMTPQVTRIDAHLLNRQGVSRLCYCGSVLHTLPSTLTATREPLQLGAELYGHAGIEADVEILRLLAEVLRLAEVPASRIDIGHVGIFHALAARAGLVPGREEELFGLLQAKDVPELRRVLADVAEPARSALLALPELYGGPQVLDEAAERLPQDAEITALLDELRQLAVALADLPVSFDLADLRGYHYHSGVVFAAYGADSPAALALGGRYDRVGQAFGRARPAVGFSLDLRELVWRLPASTVMAGAVLAPAVEDAALAEEVALLRARGEIVVTALPGHDGTWNEAGCDRQLVKRGDRWSVVPLQGE